MSSHVDNHENSLSLLSQSSLNGLVDITIDSDALKIRLQNVDKRNCLNIQMMQAINKAVIEITNDHAVKFVVVDHVSPVFSSGMDLREILEYGKTPDLALHPINHLASVLTSIASLKKPVVLCLDGLVAAAGLSFMGVADVILATKQTSLFLPELRLGVVPGLVGVTFGRLVSRNSWWQLALSEKPLPITDLPDDGAWAITANNDASAQALQTLISSIRSVDYEALIATKALLATALPTAQVIDNAAATSIEFFQEPSTLEKIRKRLGLTG